MNQALTTPMQERLIEGMTRDEICVRYQSKVVAVARRVMQKLAPESGVDIDDLVSSGALGLLEAFDRFDAERKIKFSTYAEYRIKGAMYDDLRKGDSFSRRRRQLAKRVADATVGLRSVLDREPQPEEIAHVLDMTLEEYFSAADKVKPVSHVSIHGSGGDDEGHPLIERIVGPQLCDADIDLQASDLRSVLQEAVAELPERQRQCVMMYYAKEMSLREIATVFDVTVSRISQILSESRTRLRKRLESVVDREDLALCM